MHFYWCLCFALLINVQHLMVPAFCNHHVSRFASYSSVPLRDVIFGRCDAGCRNRLFKSQICSGLKRILFTGLKFLGNKYCIQMPKSNAMFCWFLRTNRLQADFVWYRSTSNETCVQFHDGRWYVAQRQNVIICQNCHVFIRKLLNKL